MRLRKPILFLVLALTFTACRKPVSDFSFDKAEYETGDVAYLTNHSKHAEKYRWIIADTFYSDAQHLSIKLGNTANGVQSVKLVAINRQGKSSELTKTASVKKVTGVLTVWSAFPNLQVHARGLNQNYLGNTTATYSADPGCYALGCVTRSLIPNTYTVTAMAGNNQLKTTVQVIKGQCSIVELK